MHDLTSKGYEVLEEIGGGGFGIVYRAHQSSAFNREVAIKVIRPQYANVPDYIRRFEREAHIISLLQHPHIVPLIDFWRDPAGAYLVMGWLRGGNLKEMIARDPIDCETTGNIMNQICAGLQAAHQSGVIHRDIKPSNVLLDEYGNAYVADFGIAKDLRITSGEFTEADAVVGSHRYLSPEQARRDTITPRTDVYSLGVILYEMLAGEHPFEGVNPVDMIYKHLNDPLPMLNTLDSSVRESINEVIQTATAKDPAERYATAVDFVTAYREAAKLGFATAQSIVESLTWREQEILQLIVDGKSNKEIANELFIAVGTVRWHKRQIYKKLNVRSRVQAIVKARELHLIVTDGNGKSAAQVDTTYFFLPEPVNPYKGLNAFTTADSAYFFGRENLIKKLMTRMQEDVQYKRFMAVLGPSGSGKSSLVKAGLIPAIWRGKDMPGSDNWYVVEMLPGAYPLDELEVALTRVAADQGQNLMEHLERDARGLVRIGQLILPDDGSELLVVIDQFEEVFTLVEDEARRSHFLDLIHIAATDPRSRVRVVVTLRADFYDRPLQYPQFGEMLRNRMETILPLSAHELEAVIVKPARKVGVKFADGLVSTIVADVKYQPGALPLLQYALTELFDQREDRLITYEGYQAVGGTTGAIARRADSLFEEMDNEGQAITRQMFLRLVTLGEGTEDTRRRVDRRELLAIAGDEDLANDIIDTYAGYRLLALDHDPASRVPTVEVAHEAILREWERLRGWLNDSRDDIKMQRLLVVAAADWINAGRDSSYLLHGTRLDQFTSWIAETQLALTQDEKAFFDTSLAEHTRLETAERERQQRELETQRQLAEQRQRSANRLRYLVAALTAFLLVALGLSIFAFDREQKAQDARATSDANLITAEREADVNHSLVLANESLQRYEGGKPDLALALALEAVEIDDPPAEAVRALSTVALGMGTRAILRDQGNRVTAVAFNANSTRALSGGCATLVENVCTESELIVWDIESATELRMLEGQTGWINSLAFDPTNPNNVLSASDDGLILWNVETGELIRRFESHSGSVNSVAFSADGTTALSGSDDPAVILWDVARGQIIRRFEGHTAGVTTVAFSPDGQLVAAGGATDDATVVLWQVETSELVHRLVGPTASVVSLNFRSNSLVSALSFDSTYREWDVETGDIVRSLSVSDPSAGITLAPDGRNALSCSSGNACFLMDIGSWTRLGMIFTISTQQTSSNAISPDGTLALIGSDAGEVILVNLPISNEVRRFRAEGGLSAVDVSPDGRYLLTGGISNGTAILWDLQTGRIVRRLEGQEPTFSAVKFSPDGRQALLCSGDAFGGTAAGKVTLWDIETGDIIHEWTNFEFYPRSVAFSPDGRTALVGTLQWGDAWEEKGAGELVLLGLITGQEIRRFDTTMSSLDISISPDGRRAVTANTIHSTITLWDMETGEAIRQYDHTTAAVLFTDSRYFLAGSSGGFVVLKDAESGATIRSFSAPAPYYWDIDLDPDQQHVIGSTANGQIFFWNFETSDEIQHFWGHTSSSDVWNVVFSPDGKVAFSSALAADAEVIEWRIAEWPLDDLLTWVRDNRYVRDFTCEERTQYRIEPLCD